MERKKQRLRVETERIRVKAQQKIKNIRTGGSSVDFLGTSNKPKSGNFDPVGFGTPSGNFDPIGFGGNKPKKMMKKKRRRRKRNSKKKGKTITFRIG